MGLDGAVVFFAHGRGEIISQNPLQIGLVRQIAFQQCLKQGVFGVGHDHRNFWAQQPCNGGGSLGNHFVVGQKFQFSIQTPIPFQFAHEPGLGLQQRRGAKLHGGDGLGLQIVIAQHQISDFIGHGRQHFVALGHGQIPLGHDLAEQNLDIDLVIRAIDPGGIVHRVGVDTAPCLGKFDTAALGES